MVDGALQDWSTADLPEHTRAMLGFLEKMTRAPEALGPEDARRLREVGLDDEAIEDAIYICAAFNPINRLADAFGFQVPTEEEFARSGEGMAKRGYKM